MPEPGEVGADNAVAMARAITQSIDGGIMRSSAVVRELPIKLGNASVNGRAVAAMLR